MPFFQNLKRGPKVTYFFVPEVYIPGLEHFLKEELITGWELVLKRDILPHLPDGFKIPEVRLTETAPRVEKRVACFVSYYDETTVNDAYLRLIYSQAWLDWHNGNASKAMRDYEFEEAMAKDPSPMNFLRPQ